MIDVVSQCAETNGWNVHTTIDREKNTVTFDFSKFTPAGQDFFFSVTMQGDDLDSLIAEMSDYYESFDVDEETYLWLDSDGHGKNGAPYRMRDVLEDMEAAEKMMGDLLEAIRKIVFVDGE